MNKNIELIEDIKENYINYNARYFADKHRVSMGHVYKLATEFKVSNTNTWKEQSKDIINDYKKGMSCLDLSKKYGHNPSYVRRFLVKNGLKIRENGEWQTFYVWDKTFFKKIDSHEKAYWLGFIYADGNIRRKEYGQGLFQIALAKKDRNHLINLKKSLKSNHPIYKDGDAYRIIISQGEIFNDLLNLGVLENKSLTLLPPTDKQVSKEFLSSFILGYFDGDGSISINKNKKSWYMNFIGTLEICNFIGVFLKQFDINFHIYKEKRTTKNVWYININGTHKNRESQIKITKIFNLLYTRCCIYLARKKDRFQEIINSHE